MVPFSTVRIVIDYRAALRERTGVGEYAHQMIRALVTSPAEARGDETVVLWTSSWRDRPDPAALAELPGVEVADRRIPVRWLNWSWHHLQWPPIELLSGDADLAHSLHPLLLPARHAAQVVTVHDLFFLRHADRTWAEIRRDYPALVRDHVARADAVVTPSRYTAGQVVRELHVEPDRVFVCSPGPPRWATLPAAGPPRDGYLLFVGTLEPRKNVAGLLAAYRVLVDRHPGAPRLVMAGRVTPEAQPVVDALRSSPLAGRVDLRGYVDTSERERIYAGARLLVLPSWDEGFGLPVLEAMSAGVPVLVSDRGALPEVTGDAAAAQVDPVDVEGFADAMWQVISDAERANALSALGLRRAEAFDWSRTVPTLRAAYAGALARRRARGR